MIYNVITLKNGDKQKCDGKLTESQIKDYCEQNNIQILGIERLALLENFEEFNKKKGMYFKIHLGFDDEMKLTIGEDEIEKVMKAFLTGKKVQTSQGAIDGAKIILIKEDYNKTMGWNETHKLTDDDWNDIRISGAAELYTGFLSELKTRIIDSLPSGQLKLN